MNLLKVCELQTDQILFLHQEKEALLLRIANLFFRLDIAETRLAKEPDCE